MEMENQEVQELAKILAKINEEAFDDASSGYQPRYPNNKAYMELYILFKNMGLTIQ